MNRPLPTITAVQDAMDQTLADTARTGRNATIAAVERRLDIPHATFYRNFAELIPRFQQRANHQDESTNPPANAQRTHPEENLRRLRRENEDGRRAIQIYCEAIRQLTLRNQDLERELHQREGVTVLSERQHSKRTTDKN
jgi:hypothetical protein